MADGQHVLFMADCYDLGDCFSQSFNPVVSDLNGGNLRFLDHSDGTEGAYRSYETAGAPDGQHVVVAALTWPGDPPVGSLLFDPARLAAAPVNDSEAGGPAVALAQAPRFTSAVPVAQPALEFDRDNALVMHAGRIVGGQPDDGWPPSPRAPGPSDPRAARREAACRWRLRATRK
jgi:hypothetical protein